jgi:hypothetical protein
MWPAPHGSAENETHLANGGEVTGDGTSSDTEREQAQGSSRVGVVEAQPIGDAPFPRSQLAAVDSDHRRKAAACVFVT